MTGPAAKADGPVAPPGGPAVHLEGAAVHRGGRTVWKDVSLQVAPGQFAAVLGPNGVGKSTLLAAVLGRQPLAAGRLTVLGRPPGQAVREIGYLPQRRTFAPGLRVRSRDVVRLGLDGDRWGLPLPGRAARAAAGQVTEALEMVGALQHAERPVGELSGGEQQRVLIAQALVRRPRLLLLDEPLDSLDLPNQSAVAALISRICRDRGVTVLMVAHDVNPILGYLDRVVYISPRGAAAGTPQEVITAPILSGLYGTPVEVLSTSDGRLVVVGQPEQPAHHHDRHTGLDQP